MKLNKIYNMDALEGLKGLEENSIDAIVSDPPYQLSSIAKARPDQTEEGKYGRKVPFSRVQAKKGFMNKEWDVLPSVDILKECLRVMKPGAFSSWLMTPRQDSQLEFLSRLREAGFVISFSPIYWTYATGFPKSMNISKAVDKKFMYKSGAGGKTDYITESVSDEAKMLNGSFAGFQPKPAVEVIIVAMKPLSEKSYVEQALKNKHGVTWLGNCRIPYASSNDLEKRKRGELKSPPHGRNVIYGNNRKDEIVTTDLHLDKTGRFPANLLVSDDVLNNGLVLKSGNLLTRHTITKGLVGSFTPKDWELKEQHPYKNYQSNEGSLSRYFSLDAWWANRVKDLPMEVQKTFPFIYVPKASVNERDKGLENPKKKKWMQYGKGTGIKERENIEARNIHPTVKPIKLMSYLITLATQENDVVLDPFMGSGTTAISSILLNRKFIGFEREDEYFKLAQSRISHWDNAIIAPRIEEDCNHGRLMKKRCNTLFDYMEVQK